MHESKIKVDVASLKPGMYVCELDRPWLESPFLFQGFPLDNEELIRQIQDLCEFVYIDPEKSEAAVRQKLLKQNTSSQNKAVFSAKPSYEGMRVDHTPGVAVDFREHLHVAKKIHSRTRSYISDIYKIIQQGGDQIDVQEAKSLVNDMADNIMVNPHAMMWLTYLKQRHEYTMTHSVNVCILALTFGRHMRLDRELLEVFGLGALLHDIGKLRVSTEILDKPGRLTPAEFEIMKTHPEEGYQILKDDRYIHADALDIVRHHHERINGQGYPDGLDAGEISWLAKMTSIVDVYDAITSDRCYHDGMSPHKALQNIYRWTDGQFDKRLVEEFMSCMGIYPIGSIVELNNRAVGIVISTTPRTRLRPILLMVMDENHEFLGTRRILNLTLQQWDTEDHRLEISRTLEPHDVGINVREILEQESLTPA